MAKYLTVPQCMDYLHVTRPTAMKYCTKANAVIKMGWRVLIDKKVLDDYLKKVRTEQYGETKTIIAEN